MDAAKKYSSLFNWGQGVDANARIGREKEVPVGVGNAVPGSSVIPPKDLSGVKVPEVAPPVSDVPDNGGRSDVQEVGTSVPEPLSGVKSPSDVEIPVVDREGRSGGDSLPVRTRSGEFRENGGRSDDSVQPSEVPAVSGLSNNPSDGGQSKDSAHVDVASVGSVSGKTSGNGGQSERPVTPDVAPDPHNGVSDSDYASAKRRRDSGDLRLEDARTIFRYENAKPERPSRPKEKEYVPSSPPALQRVTRNFDNVYARLAAEIKSYGDDPASKAKRSKARRAARLIAALGDVLQGAMNMLAVHRGANSSKLSSLSGGVSKREAAEDKAALAREKSRTERLVAAQKLDASESRELNSWLRDMWKIVESARKSGVDTSNRAALAEYNRRMMAWQSAMTQWARGETNALNTMNRDIEKEREYNRRVALEGIRHRNASSRAAAAHSYRVAEKGVRSADSLARENQYGGVYD